MCPARRFEPCCGCATVATPPSLPNPTGRTRRPSQSSAWPTTPTSALGGPYSLWAVNTGLSPPSLSICRLMARRCIPGGRILWPRSRPFQRFTSLLLPLHWRSSSPQRTSSPPRPVSPAAPLRRPRRQSVGWTAAPHRCLRTYRATLDRRRHSFTPKPAAAAKGHKAGRSCARPRLRQTRATESR